MPSTGRSLIAYPLFRLTLFMVAGIFLFDTCLRDVATSLHVSLCWALTVVVVLFLTVGRRRCRPLCYGVVLSLSAFLLGGTLVLSQRERICYDWPAQVMDYEGVVLTPPQSRPRTFMLEVDVRSLLTPLKGPDSCAAVHRTILLYLPKDSLSSRLMPGQTLRFSSRISLPESYALHSGFDYGQYLLRRNVSGTAYAHSGQWHTVARPLRLSLKQKALRWRDALSHQFAQMHLAPREQAVLTALTIGDKRSLTPEIRSVYTASGVSHILALSGMHVGILALILLALLAPLRRIPHGDIVRSLLVVAFLWAFAFVSGLSSSVVRAVTMFSLYTLAALITTERYHSVNALTLTAFIMLVYSPFYLFEVGFQLSFAAVFSILFFYPLLRDLLVLRNPAVRYVWNVMCMSVSAQLGTLPLVLYHFGAFPTYFLVANLIVAPLAFGILFMALFALLLGGVPVLGPWLAQVLNFLLLQLNASMIWIHRLYGAQFTSLHISFFQMCILFLLILAIRLYAGRRSPRRLQLLLLSVALLLLSGLF